MDDSISTVYQKLRFLYQHKFLRQDKSILPYQTHNPIKFINHFHQYHTQPPTQKETHTKSTIFSAQKYPYSPNNLLHAKSKTERVERVEQPTIQIEFRYTSAPQAHSFIQHSRKQYRSLKSSNSNQKNNKEKNRKTLYTLYQQANPKEMIKIKAKPRVPSKKLSLIQMIEERRLQDIRKKLQSQESSKTQKDAIYTNEQFQANQQWNQSQGYRRNHNKKEFLKRSPAYLYSQRVVKPNPEQLYDKDNQINPWPVSETQY